MKTIWKRTASLALALVMLLTLLPLTATPVSAAGMIANYDFKSSYNDSTAGTSLYLSNYNASYSFGTNSGLADPSYWSWTGSSATTGGGFHINLGRALSTYTIITRFYYNDISAGYYRRIIDFKNRTSDTGLYYSNYGYLHFYNYTASTNYKVSDGQLVTVALTRNSSGYLTAYLLVGTNTVYQEFYVNDSAGNGIMSSTYLHFFHDNSAGGENATSGGVYNLRIYDYAMTSSQVSTAMIGSTLSYNGNGNTSGSAPTSKTGYIADSSHTAVLASQGTLAKTGHTFTGWNTAAAGNGTFYSAGSTIYVTANRTMYAQWQVNTSTLVVDPGGGVWSGTSSSQSFTQIYNYGIAIPVPTRTGYTFAGWSRRNTYGYMTTLTAAANYTFGPTNGVTDYLTATWTANTYSIGYNLGGGSVSSTNPTGASFGSNVLVYTPTRVGYTFKGWTVTSGLNTSTARYGTTASPTNTIASASTLCVSGTSNLYFKSLTATQNGSVTLTANWTLNSYSIGYNLNGGSVNSTNPTSATFNTDILVYTPARVGYTFEGWTVTGGLNTATACYGTAASPTDPIASSAFLCVSESDSLYFRNLTAAKNGSVTLTANWSPNVFAMTLDPQGGTIQTDTYTVTIGQQVPESVTVPERWGYTFCGFYTMTGAGGTFYYNAGGSRVYLESVVNPEDFTLYAAWTHKQSTVTLHPNGGSLASGTEPAYIGNSFSQLSIPDPVKENLLFLRWEMSTSNGSLTDEDGYTVFTFGGATTAVTLSAVWLDEAQVSIENNTEAIGCRVEGLESLVSHTATDPERGITAEDCDNATDIHITFSVEDAPQNAELISAFGEKDNLPQFFDIEVSKSVTKDGSTVVTNLSELDSPLLIKIDLAGELVGRNSYRVYRLHGDTVEELSDNIYGAEYYTVLRDENGGGDEIWIRASKFSTYAITTFVTGVDTVPPDNTAGIDVTCRYIPAASIAVYSISLEWGDMQFDYTTRRYWDPVSHSYTGDYSPLEVDAACYTLGNNQIKITNDSNADVLVSTAVIENRIDGVQMRVNRANSAAAEPATAMLLGKVPAERAAALSLLCYLRLEGTPTNLGIAANRLYTRVATIAVTITALGGELTPKE